MGLSGMAGEVGLEELAEDLRSLIYERKWERAIDTIKLTQRLFRFD